MIKVQFNCMEINYHWKDCSVSFDCPFCGESHRIDSEDEVKICVCGTEYTLSISLHAQTNSNLETIISNNQNLVQIGSNSNS